jgi:hypothetical protein
MAYSWTKAEFSLFYFFSIFLQHPRNRNVKDMLVMYCLGSSRISEIVGHIRCLAECLPVGDLSNGDTINMKPQVCLVFFTFFLLPICSMISTFFLVCRIIFCSWKRLSSRTTSMIARNPEQGRTGMQSAFI